MTTQTKTQTGCTVRIVNDVTETETVVFSCFSRDEVIGKLTMLLRRWRTPWLLRPTVYIPQCGDEIKVRWWCGCDGDGPGLAASILETGGAPARLQSQLEGRAEQ